MSRSATIARAFEQPSNLEVYAGAELPGFSSEPTPRSLKGFPGRRPETHQKPGWPALSWVCFYGVEGLAHLIQPGCCGRGILEPRKEAFLETGSF